MIQIQRHILGKFIVMKYIEIKQIFSMLVESKYINLILTNYRRMVIVNPVKINSKLLA